MILLPSLQLMLCNMSSALYVIQLPFTWRYHMFTRWGQNSSPPTGCTIVFMFNTFVLPIQIVSSISEICISIFLATQIL